jgi:cyclic pyranopterin phosphate synthase
MKAELTHLKENGQPCMVDVGHKSVSKRTAEARGSITLPERLVANLADNPELVTKKGSVIHTAIIAGTQAVKRTAELIPFCHPLPVESIDFSYQFVAEGVLEMNCKVSLHHKTGVEMEALTGVSVALLTVYDMCKSAGQDMLIEGIELVLKTGGKSDIVKTAKGRGVKC